MKIAVVGAGLAGLATASFLARDGHDVTVFERDNKLEGRGLGILIQPLGLAMLKQLGLEDKVLANGTRIEKLHLEKIKKNKLIYELPYKELEPQLFAAGIHRPRLFNILLDNARQLGVKFVTGCNIEDAVLKGNQRQLLDDSKDVSKKDRGTFDLVVDSSGYKSPLRKYATVTRHKDYTEGYVCFTTDDKKSLKNSFQDATTLRYEGKHSLTTVPIGKDPITGKEQISFFWAMPVDKFATFNLDEWKKEITAVLPSMKPYVDQITSPHQVVLAHYSDVSLKTFNADKLVFVGDSAHSTSPLLGQSTMMGFIDAFVLSKVLQREPDLQKALTMYSAERKKQVKFQQDNSRTLTRMFQSVAPPTRFLGDVVIPKAMHLPGMHKFWLRMVARAERSTRKSVLRRKYGI